MKLKAILKRVYLIVLRALGLSWCRTTRLPVSGIAIPCWNCPGTMYQFAEDSFYYFFECPRCGKERSELKKCYPGKITGDAAKELRHADMR